ncbi:MAG: hypothetical protein R2789_03525 [Microthrixaceae bacterium]
MNSTSLHREHEARHVDLGAGLIGLQCPGILEVCWSVSTNCSLAAAY